MVGTMPLWSNLFLGDIGRHGKTDVYKHWSEKFGALPCITYITRTKGIIEKRHVSLKHMYLNNKNARIDEVIPQILQNYPCTINIRLFLPD